MSSDNQLHLSSVIGFCGTVLDGLIVHPDGEHVIFPLGSTVVMRNRNDPGSQKFFRGHTDMVRRLCCPTFAFVPLKTNTSI